VVPKTRLKPCYCFYGEYLTRNQDLVCNIHFQMTDEHLDILDLWTFTATEM